MVHEGTLGAVEGTLGAIFYNPGTTVRSVQSNVRWNLCMRLFKKNKKKRTSYLCGLPETTFQNLLDENAKKSTRARVRKPK